MKAREMKLFFIAILIISIVSACTEQESAGDDSSLVGTIWILNSLNGSELVPFTSITAEFFEKGIVAGSAGCNNYTVAYEVDGANITFNMSPAATTRRACPEPIMDQENDYLAALASVSIFSVSENELTLSDSSDTVVAVYSAVSQDLAATSWIVVGYNNGAGGVVSVQANTLITANFGADGQLTGNASCNNYFGPYKTDGNNIDMGPFGTTRKLCPDPIMDQENQYFAALETAVTYKFDGITLNMRTADDATAVNLKPAVTVTGMVTNGDNAPIPEGTIATIIIEDSSRADAQSTVIGEQIIENLEAFPFPYEVPFDPSSIRSPNYTMRARLTDAAGNLIFINDTSIPVITNGITEDVEIPVIQVGE